MKVRHLYTAGDGYCANAVWPMWSQILADILGCNWTNIAQIGAGNEAIATQVLDTLGNLQDTQDSLWLVQWTQADRLDLQNPGRFKQQIAQDSVYYKNFFGPYWCSSASKIPFVDEYNRFIPQVQHQSRSRLAQLAVATALDQRRAEWRYLLTYPADWREQEFIAESKWLLPSLQEFRKSSQYHEFDTGSIQPPSLINLDWVEQHVLPWVDHDPAKFAAIKQSMLSQL